MGMSKCACDGHCACLGLQVTHLSCQPRQGKSPAWLPASLAKSCLGCLPTILAEILPGIIM